jgi:hypothetical protein
MQEFSVVEVPWVHSKNESRGGFEQQTSERFICREEKGCMGACSRIWKPVVPWVKLEIGFL